MIMLLAATTACHGPGFCSHLLARSRKSIASPISQHASATMHSVGGFMFDSRSTSVPTTQ